MPKGISSQGFTCKYCSREFGFRSAFLSHERACAFSDIALQSHTKPLAADESHNVESQALQSVETLLEPKNEHGLELIALQSHNTQEKADNKQEVELRSTEQDKPVLDESPIFIYALLGVASLVFIFIVYRILTPKKPELERKRAYRLVSEL